MLPLCPVAFDCLDQRKESTMRPRQWSVLAFVVLALTGCGSESGPKVASANGGAGSGAQPSASATTEVEQGEALRRFAQCMRDNGVDMPDPEVQPGGGVIMRRRGTNVDPNDDKFQAAMQKCRTLLPNGGVPPTMSPEQLEQMQKFAKCMRDNGIDMPDPDPATGGVRIQRSAGAIDPESQKFQDAMKACEHLRPAMGRRG
jgi:hypothetical protein